MFRFDIASWFAKAIGQESDTQPTQAMGVPIQSGQYRHFEVVTLSATPFPNGPCDAFIATTLGSVTAIGADDPGGMPVAIPVAAGIVQQMACSAITASSAGVVVALWHRTPSTPQY